MANNSFLPVVPGPASAGAVEQFSNEDIGGIKYPNIRVLWGAAGVATPVSTANPLPVVHSANINIGTMPSVTIGTAIPAGTANIGDVDVLTMPAITIAASQTVGISGAIPSGTNNIGDVDIATMPAVTIAASQSVGISGSLPTGSNTIGNVGLTGSIPTGSNIIGSVSQNGNWNVRIQDGAGNALTSAARGGERALSVQIVDAAGAQITSFSGGAGGTSYTEDAALPADPVGGALIARRRDTLSATEVSADGDAVVVNATSKGQIHTLAQIDPAQLGAVGPQTKANSTSVTMATDEQVAHGTTDSGNPAKVGGKAYSTHPTLAGDQTRSNFITDRVGKQIAVNAIRELKGSTSTQLVTTAETAIIAAAGSAKYRDLYGLIMANTSGAATLATIRDSTSGTPVSVWLIPAGDTRGFTLDCGSAMRQASPNSDWTVAVSPLASGSVHVTALWVENV